MRGGDEILAHAKFAESIMRGSDSMRFDERVSAEKFRENLYKMIGRGASQKDIVWANKS